MKARIAPCCARRNSLQDARGLRRFEYDSAGRARMLREVQKRCRARRQLKTRGSGLRARDQADVRQPTPPGAFVDEKNQQKTFHLERNRHTKIVRGCASVLLPTFADFDATFGRMIRESTNGEPVASFTYGYLDKVTSVTRLRADSATDGQARGGDETHFHYNAAGMLVGKSKSGQRLELWQWDGLALVARGDEAYINEGHVSGASALMSRSLSEGDERYLLTDYLGTTLAAFDAKGDRNEPTEATAWNYTRTSFGAGSDSPEAMSRFTGKPYDADLDAHVFPYRNYRSDMGRWMSADPIGFPDGPNQHYYAPVPTMGVDPLGLYSLSEIAANTTVNHSGISQNVSAFNNALYVLYHDGGKMGRAMVDHVMNNELNVLWAENQPPAGGPARGDDPPLVRLDPQSDSFIHNPSEYFGENIGEYVDNGAIVLGHEFGHALMDLFDPQNVFVENMLRKAMGIDEREAHHGDPAPMTWDELDQYTKDAITAFEN